VNHIFFNYVDWTLEDVPRPFYVGKGKIERVQKRERNAYWKNIAAKYGWRREVVFATKDEQFAFEEEKRRILELGTFEDGTFGRWGANLTKGGEGASGYRHRPEHIQSLTGTSNPFFGKKHSLDSIERNRQAHLGTNSSLFGKKRPEEVAAKTRGEKNGMYGRRGKDHPSYGRKPNALKGEDHPNASLTWELVEQIRSLATQGITAKQLALLYGVTASTVWRITSYRLWKSELKA
jgi:hypothetical protein